MTATAISPVAVPVLTTVSEDCLARRAAVIASTQQGRRTTATGRTLCTYCSCFAKAQDACASKTHLVLASQQAASELAAEAAAKSGSVGAKVGRFLARLGSMNAARAMLMSVMVLGTAGASVTGVR